MARKCSFGQKGGPTWDESARSDGNDAEIDLLCPNPRGETAQDRRLTPISTEKMPCEGRSEGLTAKAPRRQGVEGCLGGELHSSNGWVADCDGLPASPNLPAAG